MSEPATRTSLTRDGVIEAARTLVVEEGLDAVSLRRVAAALGVTAPALYAYVEGKDDLMRGVAERAFADLMARFDAVAADDPLDRIRAFSTAYLDFALGEPELFKTMFLFPPDLGLATPGEERLDIAGRAFEAGLAGVRDAIATGQLPAGTDPTTAGLVLWTATHGLADVLLLGFALDDGARRMLEDAVLHTVIAGLQHPDAS